MDVQHLQVQTSGRLDRSFGLCGNVMAIFHNSFDFPDYEGHNEKNLKLQFYNEWFHLKQCDVIDVASSIWEQKGEQHVRSHKQMHIHIVSLWSSSSTPPPPFFPFELQELKMAQAQNSRLFLEPCKEQDGCRGAEVYAQAPINTSTAHEGKFCSYTFPAPLLLLWYQHWGQTAACSAKEHYLLLVPRSIPVQPNPLPSLFWNVSQWIIDWSGIFDQPVLGAVYK